MIWADILVFGGLAVLFAFLAWRPAFMAGGRRARGNRFAKRFRLNVAEADVVEFDNLMDASHRRLGQALSAACLVAGITAVLFDLSPGHHGDTTLFVILLVFAVFTQTSSVVAEVAANHGAMGPRTAHVQASTVHHYVNPLLRVYLTLLGAVGAIIVCLAITQPVLVPGLTIALGSTPIAMLIVCELGAHILVSLPQRAATPAFLYVRDALRSQYLNGLFIGAGWTSALCVSLGLAGFDWGYPIGLVPLFGGFALQAVLEFSGGSPFRRFRRHFWPQLASDEILSTTHVGVVP